MSLSGDLYVGEPPIDMTPDEARACLSAWSERRPRRDETARALLANRMAAHLPQPAGTVRVSDADLDAMRAAFIRRFDEDLPRTETLMAVAHIGYRMALRDAQADRSAKRQDPQGLGPEDESPVPAEQGCAQTIGNPA
jgi:hypothetical protein